MLVSCVRNPVTNSTIVTAMHLSVITRAVLTDCKCAVGELMYLYNETLFRHTTTHCLHSM